MAVVTARFENGKIGNTIATTDSGNATSFNAVNTANGGAVIYDDTVCYGHAAAKITQGSPVGNNSVSWSTALGGTLTDHYGRFYFYITANPGSLKDIWFCDLAGAIKARLFLNITGTITLSDSTGGGGLGTTTASVNLNAWNRIEYHIIHSATVGQVEIKLFKTANSDTPTETKATAATLNTGTGIDRAIFGFTANGTVSEIAWYDNLLAGETAYPGNGNYGKVPLPYLRPRPFAPGLAR